MAQTVYETAKKNIQDQLDAKTAELATQSSRLSEEQQKNSNLQNTISGLNVELKSIKETDIKNVYGFSYQNRDYTWTIPVPIGIFYYYRSQTRATDDTKYSAMATDTYGDNTLNILVDEINKIVLARDYKKIDVINIVGIFTKFLTHTNKDNTAPYDDYACYPIETLLANGGDSEDNSILAAAILTRMDFNVVFFVYPDLRHVALGIDYPAWNGTGSWAYQGTNYYYLETTGIEIVELGNIPLKYSKVEPVIVPITK